MYQAPNTRYKVLIHYCLSQCRLSTVYRVLSTCTQFLQTILSSVYLSLLVQSSFNQYCLLCTGCQILVQSSFEQSCVPSTKYQVPINDLFSLPGTRYLYRLPSNNPVLCVPLSSLVHYPECRFPDHPGQMEGLCPLVH